MKPLPLIALLLLLSCDEHLPPRDDPNDLLSARMETTWSLTSLENRIYLRLVLTNSYDEVIEGTLEVDGSITIALARNQSYSRTFPLGTAQIDDAPVYNPGTGYMLIPPGASMSFLIGFDWRDDTGRDVRAVMEYVVDPGCNLRKVAERETFIVHGEAKLFKRISAAAAKTVTLDLCHVDVWVNPKFCPPVTGPTERCLK